MPVTLAASEGENGVEEERRGVEWSGGREERRDLPPCSGPLLRLLPNPAQLPALCILCRSRALAADPVVVDRWHALHRLLGHSAVTVADHVSVDRHALHRLWGHSAVTVADHVVVDRWRALHRLWSHLAVTVVVAHPPTDGAAAALSVSLDPALLFLLRVLLDAALSSPLFVLHGSEEARLWGSPASRTEQPAHGWEGALCHAETLTDRCTIIKSEKKEKCKRRGRRQ